MGVMECSGQFFFMCLCVIFLCYSLCQKLDLHVDIFGQLDLFSFSLLPVSKNIDYRLDLTHVPSYCAKAKKKFFFNYYITDLIYIFSF